ncbi:nuclear transport factor 2 family protein [Pseudonocardia endophytica]|uniref:SnoaL-like protein n=1 Tax=Pseudonocardia endophytica TaxID=401976 RepID=A0A4R1I2Q1_PSEEN|nr:nuclear transport factor 2 family protein [Pseudonocardia endophytica]TCK27580.1 SnoaL-like protein [Pseudonocardia endophytica]
MGNSAPADIPDLDLFCNAWGDALTSRSTDAVLELTSPDITWDDTVFWPSVVHGHDELRRYMDTVWKTMPDYEYYEVGRFFGPSGDRAVVLWGQRGSGTAAATAGATFDFQGCDVFLRFEEGKLAHYQAAYEITDMARQLGLLPPRGDQLGVQYLRSLTHQQA